MHVPPFEYGSQKTISLIVLFSHLFIGPGDQAEVTRLLWFVPLRAESFH